MTELPGKELAQELINQSRAESRKTPMEAVIQAAQEGSFDAEQTFRLIGRLWTLERMFYYIYGGWGQGLEVNDFPPSVKHFFSRQIVDESTHEMLYMDAMLRQGWVGHAESRLPTPIWPICPRLRPGLLRLFATQLRHVSPQCQDCCPKLGPQDSGTGLDGGAG